MSTAFIGAYGNVYEVHNPEFRSDGSIVSHRFRTVGSDRYLGFRGVFEKAIVHHLAEDPPIIFSSHPVTGTTYGTTSTSTMTVSGCDGNDCDCQCGDGDDEFARDVLREIADDGDVSPSDRIYALYQLRDLQKR